MRLKIGSYIIDGAESGSTSTTTGARLLLPKTGLEVFEAGESAEFEVICYFAGLANTAALKTAVEAVKAAIADNTNQDVVIEYTSGSTLRAFKTSTFEWDRINGTVRSRMGKKSAVLTITVRAERIGPPSTAGGLPSGSIQNARWQWEQTVSGLAAVIGTLYFTTRAAANTWLTALRGGSGRPAWLPAAFRLVQPAMDFEQQDSASVTENDYKPAGIVVAFKEISENYAGNAAFADVVAMTASMSAGDMELDGGSDMAQGTSEEPGLFVEIVVDLEFKTEGNTSFNAGDTTQVAENALMSKSEDALDVVVAVAETRLQEGTFTILSKVPVQIDLEHGKVSWRVEAVTGGQSRVLAWEEEITLTVVDRSTKVYDSDGKPERYEHSAGDEVAIEQNATIKALGFARDPGKPLGVDNKNWRRMQSKRTVRRIKKRTNSGPSQYLTKAYGLWESDGQTRAAKDPNKETIAKRL